MPQKAESFSGGQTRPHTMYADSGELDHFNMRSNNNPGASNKYSDFRNSVAGDALPPVSENKVSLSVRSDSDLPRVGLGDSGPKKSNKKRVAPPPPPQAAAPHTIQVEINAPSQPVPHTRIEDVTEVRLPGKKVHSRNSSDSSGYHDMTVSGADSPDAHKTDKLQTTLDTTSIDSGDHFNGDSGIRDMSPERVRNLGRLPGQQASPRDQPVVPNRKKKRAPLPPPGMTGRVLWDLLAVHLYSFSNLFLYNTEGFGFL